MVARAASTRGSAVSIHNRQVNVGSAAIKAINKTTKEIDASLDALDLKLGATANVCGV